MDRPTLSQWQKGDMYYITDYNIPYFWNGEAWRDSNGYPGLKRIGTTSEKPNITSGTYPGFQYYDTTLNKYIMWNGTAWVNIDGTALA